MTVRILQIDTEFASGALSQKLAEAGITVYEGSIERLRVTLESNEDFQTIAKVLETFVTTDWQFEFIERRIMSLHPYLTDDEREYVSLLTFHAIRKSSEPIAGFTPAEWMEKVGEAIVDILTEHAVISVEGVIRFRAREYLMAIDTVVHQMVEQFLTDREYEEFVSMLRFLLDSQTPTAQVLHVFCSDERVWISDAAGQLVRDTEVLAAAHQATPTDDVDAEDLAMSILITRSPCKIVIHDISKAAPWPSFSETVERVFLDRASHCGNCSTCQELQQVADFRGYQTGEVPTVLPSQFD